MGTGDDTPVRAALSSRIWPRLDPSLRQIYSSRILEIAEHMEDCGETWFSNFMRQRFINLSIYRPANKGGTVNIAALTTVLSLLRVAVILVDDRMRVCFLNRMAERRIAEREPLAVIQGRLLPSNEAGARRLRAAIRSLSDGKEGAARVIRLGADSSGRMHSVLSVLASAPRSGDNERPLIALMMLGSEAASATLPEELMQLFDLTMAEARTAAAFMAGQPPVEIARAQQVSINTVRTHFASLRTKLNAHSQAEVLRRLMLETPSLMFGALQDG
jgi:DNA-binding CsgD family transcriptional regulator